MRPAPLSNRDHTVKRPSLLKQSQPRGELAMALEKSPRDPAKPSGPEPAPQHAAERAERRLRLDQQRAAHEHAHSLASALAEYHSSATKLLDDANQKIGSAYDTSSA